MKHLLTWLCLLLMSVQAYATEKHYHIIPAPQSSQITEGRFDETHSLKVWAAKELDNESDRLMERLSLLENCSATRTRSARRANVELRLDRELLAGHENGYTLKITPGKIILTGNTPAGVFYGIASLQQILRFNHNEEGIPCGEVTDYPAYAWRSFMLDEARYFKGKKVVFELLDRMAELKMNLFHWHLTDHQGWRIEIKKYPRLTEIGSHRDSSMLYHWNSNQYDGKPHSGHYTQQEIREIVRYAAQRHITIIPEIDMPGHSASAIAAYPEMGCKREPMTVPCVFGPIFEVYDITRPEVVEFLQDILLEVIDLFPSPVIHIGGDEVRYNHWNDSPAIRKYMEEHKIGSAAELQLRFTNYISNWLEQQGKRMMGWNEITGAQVHDFHHDASATHMGEKLSKRSIVHFWKGKHELITRTVKEGYDIVNSTHTETYLDYSEKELTLEKAYAFNPTPEGLTPEEQRHVLGLGCQMWGEFIPTVADMNRMVYPRIAAYSEAGWTAAARKDYGRFTEDLHLMREYWRTLGITPEQAE